MTKKEAKTKEISASGKEALERAKNWRNEENAEAAIEEFAGNRELENVIPGETVLTFSAWRGKGRTVRKGEKGFRMPHPAFIPYRGKDKATGAKKKMFRPKYYSVFHVSQTDEMK